MKRIFAMCFGTARFAYNWGLDLCEKVLVNEDARGYREAQNACGAPKGAMNQEGGRSC
jgi:hypothetical protein